MMELHDNNVFALFDDACNMCSFFVRFLKNIDRENKITWVSIYSKEAEYLKQSVGITRQYANSIIVIKDSTGNIAASGVLCILKHLGGVWYYVYWILRLFPESILNRMYNLVARSRYIFNRATNSCAL